MTRNEAEQLYVLMSHPAWQAFISYKQGRLNQLHEQLEWETHGLQKVQGQIAEIRNDLVLQKTVNDFLSTAQRDTIT